MSHPPTPGEEPKTSSPKSAPPKAASDSFGFGFRLNTSSASPVEYRNTYPPPEQVSPAFRYNTAPPARQQSHGSRFRLGSLSGEFGSEGYSHGQSDTYHIGQTGYQMTLETDQGPLIVPVELDLQQASKVADEKRKRNAGASARFRARRKEKEKEASQKISDLQQELREMKQERDFYRNERDFFRDFTAVICTEGRKILGDHDPILLPLFEDEEQMSTLRLLPLQYSLFHGHCQAHIYQGALNRLLVSQDFLFLCRLLHHNSIQGHTHLHSFDPFRKDPYDRSWDPGRKIDYPY
ncbi:hypothetical protein DV737_g5081, partial [Chaetothyriales sp. CBS 132003]